MVAVGDESWEASEPTPADALRVAWRHARKALRRSRWVLLPGVLVFGLVFFVLTTAKPVYVSTVTFRLVQGWERAPGTDETLQAFVMDNVLTRDVLYPVIEANDLYRVQRRKAAYIAVADFREDLEVDVTRSEMPDSTLVHREDGGALKVSISFAYRDRDVAARVTHEIADRIAEASRAASAAKYRVTIAEANRAVESLGRTDEGHGEWTSAAQAKRLEDERDRYKRVVQAQTSSVLGAAFEQEEQSLELTVLEEAVHTEGGPKTKGVAAAAALLLGVLATIVFMLLSHVGADLVLDARDLREAGLAPLGVVPLRALARNRGRAR